MVNILNFFKINKDNISAKSNHHESIENVSLQKTFLYSDKLNDTTLSLKTRNSLLRCNILTVGDLARIGLKNLLREKNIGQKTLEEIEGFLKNNNFINNEGDDNNLNKEKSLKNKNDDKTAIDERIFNYDILNLDLSYKLKNRLKTFNIRTVGDFLTVNSKLNNNEINAIYEKLEDFEIDRTKKYNPVSISIPKLYFIRITEVFDDEWIIEACKKYSLKNVGLLAKYLDKFSLDEDLINQEIFFEKISKIENKLREIGIETLPIKLPKIQEIELSKKDVSEKVGINYIAEISNVITDAFERTFEVSDAELDDKDKDILKKKFFDSKKEHTLEEIGVLYGVSRERIRQIVSSAINKIIIMNYSSFNTINEELGKLLSYYGDILPIKSNETTNLQSIIKEILKKMPERCFDIDFENNIIFSKGLMYEKINKEFLDSIDNTSDTIEYSQIKLCLKEVLNSYLQKKTQDQRENYEDTCEFLLEKLVSNHFFKFDDDLYKFIDKTSMRRNQNRDSKLMYWFEKVYPQGVHLPEKQECLKEVLKPLYEKCEEVQGLDVRSLSERLIKENKDVIRWDRGTYIHVNNINVDWDAVDFAIDKIIDNFDSGLFRIKLGTIYKTEKERFYSAGILNECALIGLIKYKNHPRINIYRDELRDNKNSNLELTLLESFEDFILQYPDGISRNNLLEEMCDKRGRKPYQIDLLCNRSRHIFCDNGCYFHCDNLKIDEIEFKNLVNIIAKEVSICDSGFVHLRKIKEENSEVWNSIINKDISPEFMGKLINLKFDVKDFIIDNFIYAKKNDHRLEDISLYNILDEYIKDRTEEQKYTSYKEIEDFCSERGIKNTKQYILNKVMQFTYEYDEEVYVHRTVIDSLPEFQEDFFALMQKISEEESLMPFIYYKHILLKYEDCLPTLGEEYVWNTYLLRSLLRLNENISVFDKVFIFKNNNFKIEDIGDIAACIILGNSDVGTCNFNELDDYMSNLGITPRKKLHLYKPRLFFEGSSVKLIDNVQVIVEDFAKNKFRAQ